MVNVELSHVIKIGNWVVRPSVVTPYIGKSVWTFFLTGIPDQTHDNYLLKPDDGLKFGISGSYGFAKYSAYIKYSLADIFVVDSREPWIQMDALRNPVLGSVDLENSINYLPEDAQGFRECFSNLL